MIRFLGRSRSIQVATMASRALRMRLLYVVKKTFFASCWAMVLPPRA